MAKEVMSRKERLQKEREDLKKGGSFDTFLMTKEGKYRMRALNVGDTEDFAMEVTYFFLNKDLGGFVSPITFGDPCYAMEKYEELKKSKDESKKALAEKIKPKKRYAMLHIRYKDDKGKQVDEQNGEKLMLLTGGLYGAVLDLFLDDENGDFTDFKTGYDLKYQRIGTGQFDTEYSVMPCRPTPIDKKYRQIYNLEEYVRKLVLPYEDIKEKIDSLLGLNKKKKSSDEPSGKIHTKKKKSKVRE